MSSDGGAALAAGIWFQSIGAIASMVDPWKFDGIPGSVHGEALGQAGAPEVFVEYFDMDAVIFKEKSVQFVQFKVTSQRNPKNFDVSEVREILQNATRAILRHKKANTTPVDLFVVATNRPSGVFFTELSSILASLKNQRSKTDYAVKFASSKISGAFFPNPAKSSPAKAGGTTTKEPARTRTLKDFAKSVVYGKAGEWDSTLDECVEACLHAMSCFKFASAKADRLVDDLNTWLRTWGLFDHECRNFAESILGKLINLTSTGGPLNQLKVIREILNAQTALPIVPKEIWHRVTKKLLSKQKDGPTYEIIKADGFSDWMLDRSELFSTIWQEGRTVLSAQASVGWEEDLLYSSSPRVFALVGEGGTGKTGLLAHFMSVVAGKLWDWNKGELSENGRFEGYPYLGVCSCARVLRRYAAR